MISQNCLPSPIVAGVIPITLLTRECHRRKREFDKETEIKEGKSHTCESRHLVNKSLKRVDYKTHSNSLMWIETKNSKVGYANPVPEWTWILIFYLNNMQKATTAKCLYYIVYIIAKCL